MTTQQQRETDRQAQIAVMQQHGGWPDAQRCPTHGYTWCGTWTDAWVAYERGLDDERAERGGRRLYAYASHGRAGM